MALTDFDLVLFGGSGDLAMRKLLPAMYARDVANDLPPTARIICVGRQDSGQDAFLKMVESNSRPHIKASTLNAATWSRFCARIVYVSLNASDASTYAPLVEALRDGADLTRVYYLATPPHLFALICDNLEENGLVTPNSRVVLEKPLGRDLASAKQINAEVGKVFQESQIYRIDHYLGKETVQNILISRFSNVLFEAFWNNHYIDHVQITAAETVGVETRGSFFEHTGTLRDMVPNHLFQLLAMVAMEPPAAFGADAVRGEKAKVIGAIRPWSLEDARANSVRGQYTSGEVGGKQLPGYREEANVAPDSSTETFVALKVLIDNWRWVGVPFYLRTGKRMSIRDTEIIICFKPAPYAQFRDTEVDELKPTYLKIQIQPNEGMWFDLLAKKPGPTLDMANVELGFAYKDFFEMQPSTGYETLIYDCMTGDQTLFQRADNIENGWRAVQPFLDAWKQDDGIQAYKAGEDGPAAADALLARDGRTWHSLG